MKRWFTLFAALSATALHAGALSWKGGADTSWDTAANWEPEQVPTAADDVTLSLATAKVYAPNGISVNSLSLSGGAELHLGDSAARTAWTASVAGDLSVSGSAKLYAYAALQDISVFADRDAAVAALYANATQVTVGGTMAVSGGACVYPSNDPGTGTPVFFRVGDLDLASDGSFNTRKLGWRWVRTAPATGVPDGAAATANGGYAFAFGVGSSYSTGAGYGGFGGYHTAKFGQKYGTPFAPFLPGSPSGWYAAANWQKIVAPGSIVVFATRTASLAGTMDASADRGEYGGNSGGGIWVAAKTLAVSPGAQLLAPAQPFPIGNYKGGGGGRIALVENATGAEIDSLAAAADLPAGFVMHDLAECRADVSGCGPGVGDPVAGTAVYVTYCGVGLSLDNRTDTDVVAEGLPFHAVRLVDGSPYSVTAPAYGYSSADPGFERHPCLGYIFSNATEQVAASASTTLYFTPSAADGPYSATWLWGGREHRIGAEASGHGTATVQGGSDVWVADGDAVTLSATPDPGYRFAGWFGDLPGGLAREATVAFTPSRGGIVTAVFVRQDGATSAKAWSGAAGTALWDDPANWSPAGVPTPDDAVTISAGSVYAPRRAVAGSLSVAAGASFRLAATGTSATAAPQDATERSWSRFLFVAGDLESAGTVALGGIGDAVLDFVFEIGGDMALSGNSRTAVYAARGVGAVDTASALFAKRTALSVGGDLVLSDTAILYPVADPLTGTAVLVSAGDVSIATGAGVSAKGLGYDALPSPDGVADARAVTSFSRANPYTGVAELYQTFGPGPGSSYTIGGGHGGRSAAASGIFGRAYGSPHAPLFCGSPSGYLASLNTYSAGGGVVWIRARGTLSADGLFDAQAAVNASSGAAGGSIWLLAKTFSFGDNVRLLANGGNGSYSPGGASGGGRVSLASGLTDAALAEIVSLENLTDDYIETEITECPYSVDGGVGGNTSHGFAGTATRVSYIAGGTFVVQASDTPVEAEGITFVATAAADGEAVSILGPEYGYLSANPENVRFACAGSVVSNAFGEVARTASRTAAFTVDASLGPYTNVWLWENREERFRADVSGNGSAAIAGQPSLDVWLAAGASAAISATPDPGHRLVGWIGDVPGRLAKSASVRYAPSAGNRATAVFARADGATSEKSWTGAAGSALWDDPANWSPAGVPTADDDVTVASATVYAPRGAIAASLSLGNGSKLVLAATSASLADAAQDAGERSSVRFLLVLGDLASSGTLVAGGSGEAVSGFHFEVGGDMVLSGSSETAIYAARTDGPLDPASLFGARTDFAVGGTLSLSDSATLYTVCDPLTGTSVRIAASRLSVATGATVSSYARGWQWCRCPDGTTATRDPRAHFVTQAVTPATNLRETYQSLAPGTGFEYSQGAGHGGLGGYYLSRSATYGQPYGRELAPVQPGSPNGIYAAKHEYAKRGGGVVWLAVSGDAEIAGSVNANADKSAWYGGTSGGSVLISAGHLRLAPGASLSAAGSPSGYNAEGAGGRIAIAEGLSAARLAELGATGTTTLPARRILDEESFALRFPGVSANVSRGGGERAQVGTFRFLDGIGRATVLRLR